MQVHSWRCHLLRQQMAPDIHLAGRGVGGRIQNRSNGSWELEEVAGIQGWQGGPGQGRAPLSQEPLCTLPAALKPLPLSPNQAQAHSNQ